MSFIGFTVGPRGNAGIQITGLVEVLSANAAMLREMPQFAMDVHREASEFFSKDALANVHVITGKTKSSIKIDSVTPQSAVISAGFGAAAEEQREGSKPPPSIGSGRGPHKFMSGAATRTGQQMPLMIKKHFDALLARHRTR